MSARAGLLVAVVTVCVVALAVSIAALVLSARGGASSSSSSDCAGVVWAGKGPAPAWLKPDLVSADCG